MKCIENKKYFLIKQIENIINIKSKTEGNKLNDKFYSLVISHEANKNKNTNLDSHNERNLEQEKITRRNRSKNSDTILKEINAKESTILISNDNIRCLLYDNQEVINPKDSKEKLNNENTHNKKVVINDSFPTQVKFTNPLININHTLNQNSISHFPKNLQNLFRLTSDHYDKNILTIESLEASRYKKIVQEKNEYGICLTDPNNKYNNSLFFKENLKYKKVNDSLVNNQLKISNFDDSDSPLTKNNKMNKRKLPKVKPANYSFRNRVNISLDSKIKSMFKK